MNSMKSMHCHESNQLYEENTFNDCADLYHEPNHEIKEIRKHFEEAIKDCDTFTKGCLQFETQTNSQSPSTCESNYGIEEEEISQDSKAKAKGKAQKKILRIQDSSSTYESSESSQNIYEAITKEGKTRGGKRGAKPLEANESGEILSDTSSEKKNWNQNIMKNHQGSFAAKIKKCCQEKNRLFMFVTFGLSEEKREAFRKYALSYNKQYKTWSKLIDFLKTNIEFGVLFTQMIIFFFTAEFAEEYKEFILGGSQMKQETRALLIREESKDFYLFKFDLVKQGILGECPDFMKKIKESRKVLKVEA